MCERNINESIFREAVVYDRFFEIRRQKHEIFSHEAGTAVRSPGVPWWVKLRGGIAARRFFDEFYYACGSVEGFRWVAEESVAREIVNAGLEENAGFSTREMVAYYLPAGVVLPSAGGGVLRQPLMEDFVFLFAGVEAFYREALGEEPPRVKAGKRAPHNEKTAARPDLYVWAPASDAPLTAMGVLAPVASYGGKNNARCEGHLFRTRRLNLIYVPPKNRRAGYGRAVVTALCEVVRGQNAVPILYAYGDNTAARRLYEKLGFTEAGRVVEITDSRKVKPVGK